MHVSIEFRYSLPQSSTNPEYGFGWLSSETFGAHSREQVRFGDNRVFFGGIPTTLWWGDSDSMGPLSHTDAFACSIFAAIDGHLAAWDSFTDFP